MSKQYTPSTPFDVAAFLLIPTKKVIKGVTKKVFTAEDEPFFCSFKTFGGTETNVNGLTVVEDTAVIETWFDPKIKNDCRVNVGGVDYEIISTPENINMRNQYLKFKIRAIKGGA